MVDAGGGAEGEGAGPGGDKALRVRVRHPGVSSVCPRPVVVELSHASQSGGFFCGEASSREMEMEMEMGFGSTGLWDKVGEPLF